MDLKIAVCVTASDAVAARKFFGAKGYTAVTSKDLQNGFSDVAVEEWSGWEVDPATGQPKAPAHPVGYRRADDCFVLAFMKA